MEPKVVPSGSQVEQGGASQLLRRYLALVSKRKWLILTIVLLALAVTAAWTYTRVPIYSATASVLVERRAPQVLGQKVGEVVDLSTGHFWQNREYKATQVRVIESRRLAALVVEQLNLSTAPAFWKPGRPPKERKQHRAIGRLRQILAAKPIRKANIIQINVRHPDPEMAATIANKMVEVYLDQNISYKTSSTSGAVKWLANQLDSLKLQLEKAELALHEFKKRNNVVSALENKQSVLVRRIEKYSDAYTEVHIKKLALASARAQLRRAAGKDPLDLPVKAVNEDPTVQALRGIHEQAVAKHDALLQRYGEKHPFVRAQQARLASARAALKKQISSIRRALEGDYRAIVDNERRLAAALQNAKNEALDLSKREVAYRRLKRDQENTERLYRSVLARMKESELSSRLKFNNLRALDAARRPSTPVSPRVKLSMLIGLFLGVLVGVLFALLLELLDTSVKSEDDITAIAGLVYIGMLPQVRDEKLRRLPHGGADLIVHTDPKSPAAESCRSIRTNLLFTATDRQLRSLVVTSPGPREGKTTTAISIAIAMAQSGSKTLLLDTDMRRPRLHKAFGFANGEGLTTILLGEGPVDQAVRSTDVPNLFLLPSGPTPPNPAEICQSETFKSLLGELGETYDTVVLDSPPVGAVTDAAILSTLSDGALLVARAEQTHRMALRDAYRQIADVGGTVLGCVLDDVDLQKRTYGYYGMGRYASYGYKYSYGGSDE